MSRKTQKNNKTILKYAKNATMKKCRMKTCRAKKYQSVYGASMGGSIRENRTLF
jgi:hypothetical protein